MISRVVSGLLGRVGHRSFSVDHVRTSDEAFEAANSQGRDAGHSSVIT